MGRLGNTCHSLFSSVFYTYSTVKLVKVPNTCLALAHRLLQLVIFIYIIGYIVVWKKGYQQVQEPQGTSIIKVKGIAKVTGNRTFFRTSEDSKYIWDVAEYEIPPLEDNAFFIGTHQTITHNQTQGVCATALDDKLWCTDTNRTLCKVDQPTPNTFGFLTGNCIPKVENETRQVCEMNGWCPEELTASTDYVINEVDLNNFTVFLKTMVTFSLLKKNLRNVQDNVDFDCRYDGTPRTAECPIFRLGYILDRFNTNRTALMLAGGLIEIRQDWTCNFDISPKKCVPTYDFVLLQSGDVKQSPGINFRFAQKYRVNEIDYRTLTKVYGLRFVVSITGKGGQFNIVNLFVAIGSGIGFMAIASIVCDLILINIHRSRERYRQGKFSVCEVDDKHPISFENFNRA